VSFEPAPRRARMMWDLRPADRFEGRSTRLGRFTRPIVFLGGALVAATSCASPAGPSAIPSIRPVVVTPVAASPSPTIELVAVPDLRFQTVTFARIDVKDAGLKLSVVEKSESLDYDPETILTQKPKSGTLVERGTKVKVTITILPPCHPSYPDICLAPRGPDIDCEDIDVFRIRVLPPDPYDLDVNGDGLGCANRGAHR
jgi:hypothetical protein